MQGTRGSILGWGGSFDPTCGRWGAAKPHAVTPDPVHHHLEKNLGTAMERLCVKMKDPTYGN